MSNLGVITLGSLKKNIFNKIRAFKELKIEDNIGESIHIHIDNFRIDLTIKQFSANLEEAAKQLITKANQNGGKDNISVMLCRIDDDFSTRKGWFKKFVAWFDD